MFLQIVTNLQKLFHLWALLWGKTPKGTEITFMRKVEASSARKTFTNHLWGNPQMKGTVAPPSLLSLLSYLPFCLPPSFPSSGYSTLTSSGAWLGWLTPYPWLPEQLQTPQTLPISHLPPSPPREAAVTGLRMGMWPKPGWDMILGWLLDSLGNGSSLLSRTQGRKVI